MISAFCENCDGFCNPQLGNITGDGATLNVGGEVKGSCPKCGQTVSSPGGQFKLYGNEMMRVSSNITPEQASVFKDRLLKLKEAGVSEDTLKQIIQGYAPELVDMLDKFENPDEDQPDD